MRLAGENGCGGWKDGWMAVRQTESGRHTQRERRAVRKMLLCFLTFSFSLSLSLTLFLPLNLPNCSARKRKPAGCSAGAAELGRGRGNTTRSASGCLCDGRRCALRHTDPVENGGRHGEDRLDFPNERLLVLVPQQGQTRNAEEGVEHVRDVARLVGDAAVRVLAAQDEGDEGVSVDPAQAPEHRHRRDDPPRVAHVRLLLRTPVQPSVGHLPLAQPPRELVAVDVAQATRDRQHADAAEDVRAVALVSGRQPEAAVPVHRPQHVGDGGVDVDGVQAAEEREAVEGTVREAVVDFAPLVAAVRTVGKLVALDEFDHAFDIDQIKPVVEDKDLDGGQRVEHVWVVVDVAAEAAAGMLAGTDVLADAVLVHHALLAKQEHGGQAPVGAADANMLRHPVLEAFRLAVQRFDVLAMLRSVERQCCRRCRVDRSHGAEARWSRRGGGWTQ
eukprot:Rhum_TRINITY_DN14692_c7_g1::Rhum_TRINITY_DN14692_c7_g1_i1::g.108783::m.108783